MIALPAPASDKNDPAAGLRIIRDEDVRAATVLRRLATANAQHCQEKAPISGLLIHNARQYAEPFRPAAISLFDLGEKISVEAVVPGSAADRAGLRAGDVLESVQGKPFPLAPRTGAATISFVELAMRMLHEALGSGAATIDYTRDGEPLSVRIVPELGCASTIQVVPDDRKDSGADGRIISITSAMIEFVRSDDELAVLLGHELAHNILGHPGLLKSRGRSASAVRGTEQEADRLALYLAANAGYDVGVAPALWDRLGRAFGLNIISEPTHPPLKARVAASRSTLAEIAEKRKAGHLVWP